MHYLIDPYTVDGNIIDVTAAPTGESDSTGALVVRVPDGVAIHGHPSNLAELLDAKVLGVLGSFVGFTAIASDACLDGSSIDSGASSNLVYTGGRASVCLLGTGVLTTQTQTLDFAPTQCVVVWETFSFANVDDKTGRFSRIYQESDPDAALQCEVSFDAGVSFNTTTNGTAMNIPPADQGSNAVLRFTNISGDRVYLGGWSLVY